MSYKQDGLTGRSVNFFELQLQCSAGDWIECTKGLVHQKDIWVCSHCARHANPLLLTARKLVRIPTCILLRVHRQQLQQFVHTSLNTLSVPAQQLGDRGNVVRNGSVGKQAHRLHGIAHAATQVLHVEAVDVLAVKKDVAAIVADHAVKHFEYG